MCCIVEIGIFVFGIITLVQGKFTLSSKKVVTGAPAYVIGAIMVATLPVMVVGALGLMVILAVQDPDAAAAGQFKNDWTYTLIDIIGVGISLGIVFTIASIYGKDPTAVTGPYAANPYAANPYTMPPPPSDPNNPYNPPANR